MKTKYSNLSPSHAGRDQDHSLLSIGRSRSTSLIPGDLNKSIGIWLF